MMPTVGARVDSFVDDMGENHEGEGAPGPDESDSDIDQAPADGLDADDISKAYMSLKGCQYSMNVMDLSSMTQNPPPNYYNLLKSSVT